MKPQVFCCNLSCRVLVLLRTSCNEEFFKMKIAKKLNSTIPHANHILKKFKEIGLTKEERVGRRVYITLTKKGESIADNLLKIKELIK